MSKRLTIEEFIETLKQGGSGSGESSSGGALTVNCDYDSVNERLTLDKTWRTIDDAIRSGSIVIVLEGEAGAYLATTSYDPTVGDDIPPYGCTVHGMWRTANAAVVFEAASEDDYPTYSISN